MADDHNQQAYRASEASSRGQGGGSANDPLAELARLIGQSDPFGEYGRNNGNRPPAAATDQTAGWQADSLPHPNEQPTLPNQSAYSEQAYGAPAFGRQAFGSAPLSTDTTEYYPVDAHAPGYRSQGYDPAEYPPGTVPSYEEGFPPSQEPLHDVHQQFGPPSDDGYYDDVAPSRRRIGITAIAGVFALAVLGTAGALGYRAVFGPSSAPTNPPVIKADNAPSKIVPATPNKDAGKTITDRVGNSGNGQIERLLSREEQPVPVTAAAGNTNSAFPPNQAGTAPALGSGVVGDPKKVRTIAIRPDQANDGAASAPEVAPTPTAVSTAEPTPRPISVTPRPIATTSEPARPAPQAQAPRQAAAQPSQPAQPAPAPAPRHSNAPLSLNPNAVQAQAPAQARPERVASTAPEAPVATSAGGGAYAVQVSSQRSEADAQAAFRALQGKFPAQLGGRQPVIRRADLGAKGIYFRAMVVVGSNSEAGELCSSLKAAGGSCIIQRN